MTRREVDYSIFIAQRDVASGSGEVMLAGRSIDDFLAYYGLSARNEFNIGLLDQGDSDTIAAGELPAALKEALAQNEESQQLAAGLISTFEQVTDQGERIIMVEGRSGSEIMIGGLSREQFDGMEALVILRGTQLGLTLNVYRPENLQKPGVKHFGHSRDLMASHGLALDMRGPTVTKGGTVDWESPYGQWIDGLAMNVYQAMTTGVYPQQPLREVK